MEACYNIGRAFHQLGIIDLALKYYLKIISNNNQNNNFKKEAAYNISLIYKSSGTEILSKQILFNYLTV